MAYIVYMHKNKTNNKRYFGITAVNPESRWANGEKYKANELFYQDIQAFGWDGFEHKIVAKNVSASEAEKIEKDLIWRYFTDMPEYGYNIRSGGQRGRRVKAPEVLTGDFKKLEGSSKRRSDAQVKTKRPVVCITTNEKFDSIAEAARHFDTSPQSISLVLKGRTKTAKGYRFKYLLK